MRDYDGYYRDGYYEPPPRRYRRRRRGRAGLVIFALILILALVFVWRFTDGFTRFAPPELTNVQDGFTYSLDALAGEISPDMRLDECGIDYKAELESMAANKPKLADRLNFIADHLEIYPEEAVKTALQGEEKLDFALLMPFRGEDAGGVNAVITAQKGTAPYLIQYDSRWAYHAYGSSVMGITACGPTCLSMAAIGLTGDASLTPARIADWAEDAGYYVDGAGTAWSLFTDGAAQLGLRSEAIAVDEDDMKSRLDAGEVLIASMLPGDFTTSGHFVVIVDHGLFGFNVYDPNSIALSSRGLELRQARAADSPALELFRRARGREPRRDDLVRRLRGVHNPARRAQHRRGRAHDHPPRRGDDLREPRRGIHLRGVSGPARLRAHELHSPLRRRPGRQPRPGDRPSRRKRRRPDRYGEGMAGETDVRQ